MSAQPPQRWNQGTVYADMWVDPDDDPRLGDGVADDGERATLLTYLRDYRLTLRMKCDGLDAGRLATRSVPPSTMSLLGLVRHAAGLEQYWGQAILGGQQTPTLFEGDGDDPEFDGALGDPEVVDAAFALWDESIAATDAVVASFDDLGTRVRKDEHAVAVREVLVHLIEEYARHAGHADLLRECIDGRVGQ